MHAKCKQQHHGHHDAHSPVSSAAPSPTGAAFFAAKSTLATLRHSPSNNGGPFANNTNSSIILGTNPMLGRHAHHHKTISGQSKRQFCLSMQRPNEKLSSNGNNNNYSTGTLSSNTYYSTMNYHNLHHQHQQHQQQHHQQQQQHPPTADLLGTGYQCQQQPNYSLAPPLPPPPIYHIATGNAASNQTTRLIWQQERDNGYTIDSSGGPFDPLGQRNQMSNSESQSQSAVGHAPHKQSSVGENEAGVYQTIY